MVAISSYKPGYLFVNLITTVASSRAFPISGVLPEISVQSNCKFHFDDNKLGFIKS